MSMRIALVGDPRPTVRAHTAIPRALALAAADLGRSDIAWVWVATETIPADPSELLADSAAVWCVPGSPYANMEGALAAIRFARLEARPFLGTCGGFQHAVIEFARYVAGIVGADHQESNPDAGELVVMPLACSLVGAEGTIHLREGSRARRIYGTDATRERYHCNYGLNPAYRSALEAAGLQIAGLDEAGEVRVVELAAHPFYLATLFQPELSAFEDRVHPLVRAFVAAAAARAKDMSVDRIGARGG
jgi:CTP synthase (UTP-ammonia lyase)